MSCLVCMGATLQCTFGAAPAMLQVVPKLPVLAPALPAATIADSLPLANVQPFGVCTSLANPMVATATAAALGVLVPQPCLPVTPTPWVPGCPTVLIGGVPALDQNSKLMCNWGGVISIVVPGQINTQLP
jgi:hypothetical protein